MPPTSTLKEQSSRIKNAYGLSEFPGISVNGVISTIIDLELVPVPEYDIYEEKKIKLFSNENENLRLFEQEKNELSEKSEKSDKSKILKIITRKGERFDPKIAIKNTENKINSKDLSNSRISAISGSGSGPGSGSGSSSHSDNSCRRRGEIRVRNKDPNLVVCYWKEKAATEAAVRDGWFYTGEIF